METWLSSSQPLRIGPTAMSGAFIRSRNFCDPARKSAGSMSPCGSCQNVTVTWTLRLSRYVRVAVSHES